MARGQGTYSQVVAGLKVLLPLIALGLLSTLFLFSRDTDPTRNLPVSTAESLKDRESQSASGAVYTGVAENGAEVTMRAAAARPDPAGPNGILADMFDATLAFPDGSRIDLSAPSASMDNGAGAAKLTGGVVIDSSAGYVMRTDSLTSAMNRVEIESGGRVEADGPAGRLTAGRMRITPAESPEAEEGDVQLLFTDGVRMVYEPQQQE
ncbi:MULTISPECIES: hypothetical protein [unclassified Roseivivax]|uniref:hypothetical protein n=1 Tax=Roseivivax sp. GX 12232 TaxID=2900547 RepID=UPI001E367796|nr:hypothetical protein [Roseivivax sp. GX 12232]MCE0505467.1 hypothetical protein [Roseivivax sp. GX 12232]